MYIYSKEQIRFIEHKCVELGFSERRLMENAGSFVASEVRKMMDDPNGLITVVCGKGNNGGDGFVAARKLASDGLDVTIVLPDGPMSEGLAGEMFHKSQESNVPAIDFRSQPDQCKKRLEKSHVIIDAIYGIGFRGELTSRCDLMARIINDTDAVIVSVDIPSGIECDTAVISKNAIRADKTVSFFGYKSCFVLYPSALYCGEIVVADLGIPDSCRMQSNFQTLTQDYAREHLVKRCIYGHKTTFGKVGVFCGSYGMAGAALLCAKASYRSGAGLVKMVMPDSIYPIVATALPEAVFSLYDRGTSMDEKYQHLMDCDAIVIGCGIEMTEENGALLEKLIFEYDKTLVIDATALRLLAKNLDVLAMKKGSIILTPHDGELAALCHITIQEIANNRLYYANRLARKYGVTVVGKGAHSIIHCENGSMLVDLTGNDGLATAGSGDVLAGTIAALSAQGMTPDEAAAVSVYIHGLSADLYAKRNSKRTLMAGDLPDEYKKAFSLIE